MKKDKKMVGVFWKDVEKLVHLQNYKILGGLNKKHFLHMIQKREKELKLAKTNAAAGKEKHKDKLESTQEGQNKPSLSEGPKVSENGSLQKGESGSPNKANDVQATPNFPNVNLRVDSNFTLGMGDTALRRVSEKFKFNPNSAEKSFDKHDKSHDNISVNPSITPSVNIDKLLEHPMTNIDHDLITRELRYRIYKLMKHHINEKHEEHECSSDVVRNLKSLCDICCDHVDQTVCFSEYSKVFIGSHRILIFLNKLKKIPLIGSYATKKIANRIFWEY